ncbi:hypothetical protein IQ249_22660 [Lusitaniella coriacea LEGE 07157]|uniref:Uncharacterized protein n=1 Tax=Lusitaniella coriacea LEGE 07157 TaxID=945747 RepID=A0A8J7JFD9_9CYAN|nr:hypothetical protein [Lusitaniella coriacea]MBE9118695.1 hypothetical protein [Lusitaniella coriacea LEGE 07157]
MNHLFRPYLLAGFVLTTFLFNGTAIGATTLEQLAQTGIGEVTQMPLLVKAEPPEPVALTPEDLPSGFQEIPPAIRSQLAAQFKVFGEQFGQEDLDVENFFAFFNPQSFQAVMGFTGDLGTPEQQERFDANLQKLQEPDVQTQILESVQERLKEFGNIEITNPSVLSELNDVADASTGLSVEVKMQSQAFRIDMASFRRNEMGAFTAVIYRQSDSPIAIKDLAEKLDRRIAMRTVEDNSSPTTPSED